LLSKNINTLDFIFRKNLILHTSHKLKICAIPSSEWDSLNDTDFPFSEHAFISSLEHSACVSEETGWSPCHITLWEKQELQGAICLYEKNNSFGEYIFDWVWAREYDRHDLNYYPKLVSAIPFTPATGKKLLVRNSKNFFKVQKKLLFEALNAMRKRECSSLHFLFIDQEEVPIYKKMGFLIRYSYQYHWRNNNYNNFENFLTTLKSKRRKEILRERNQIKQQMIRVEIFEGKDIVPEQIYIMYQFYLSTIYKKWGQLYLTEDFFHRIYQKMRDRLLLIMAYDKDGDCVAGSINFLKGDNLYGRYWGCKRSYKSLHFELCYYQPIEYAIRKGIKLFEAGAQGDHKIQRGFLPEITYSAHWLENEDFRYSISRFVEKEKKAICKGFEKFKPHSPYREE